MTTVIKNLKFFVITMLMIFAFQACEKENVIIIPEKEYPGVDAELWIYYQRFEEAATKRGFPVDLNAKSITGTIENLDIDNVVGLCNYNINMPHQIIIDKTFWMRASSLKKELIVFHELGHCCMNYLHRDEMTSEGHCTSIMRIGLTGCIDMYTHDSREHYLDELFQ